MRFTLQGGFPVSNPTRVAELLLGEPQRSTEQGPSPICLSETGGDCLDALGRT
jgi:hypothetical protein